MSSTRTAPLNFTAYMHKPTEGTKHRGWYKPNHLPHFDAADTYQLITYHLADSLPKTKLDQFEVELKTVDPQRIDAERRRKIEEWIDAGHGSCILKHPLCAQCVIHAWHHFDRSQYRLVAWTVMPNHVHVLIQQQQNHRLGDIVSSWKKFTARRINEFVASGRVNLPIDRHWPKERHSHHHLWQRGYWDRFIRHEQHFHAAIDYVLNNAVKAGLAKSAREWSWCGIKDSTAEE